jgi:hypothetical protein
VRDSGDDVAPIIAARTVKYAEAENGLLLASTTADNDWRDDTALAWANHTAGDLTARGGVQRGLATASSLTPDLARAAIAETKAQWWQTQIPSYLQWSTDVGAIETTYTTSVVGNRLQRVSLLQAAGVKYALDVGNAIKEYEDSSATTDEEFATAVINNHGAAALKRMLATRDQSLDLAAAELQKQLTGNEGQYNNSVSSINSAYQQKLNTAQSDLDSALKTATEQKNSKNALATKTKESKIAAAEEEYAQTEATLDAQYGTESAGGDTGTEGATRRAAIATRDAQYYAARDTSWANTLSGSTTLGNSPWSVKAISDASAQAAFSTSSANAQAAHDAAMLDAVEDWQLSSRDSLTDMLFAEGQSRETFSVATANVYADWENGVGNLLGDKPEGTEWGVEKGFGEGNGSGGARIGSGIMPRVGVFVGFDEIEGTEDTTDSDIPEIRRGRRGGHILPPMPEPDGTLSADDEYQKLKEYLETPGVDLTQIPLHIDGMHENLIAFIAEHGEVYEQLTLKYGVAYQHKLNEFFKQGFTIRVEERMVFFQSANLEMREFFLDSSGAIPFTSTSPETQAGYLQYILEVVGSQNESVKNPILRAGDIATWYSPNRSVLQATTSVAPEVRRAAIETSTMLAREVGLRAVQEKTAEVALKLTVNFGKLALRQLMAQPVGLGYPGAMPGMTRATPNSAAKGPVSIFGRPQVTSTEHAQKIFNMATDMANSGSYKSVYMHSKWSKILEGTRANVSPNRLPDIAGIRLDGKIDIIEIASKTDDLTKLLERNKEIWNQLPSHLRGDIIVIDQLGNWSKVFP